MSSFVIEVIMTAGIYLYLLGSHISSHVLLYRSKLVENYSKPSIANFGRSLFGGYCPTYVPDFVLQGLPSDEKLRQCLMAELTHAVQVKFKC